MPDLVGHIASAIVTVRPEHREAVSAALTALAGTEVYAAAGTRIVVVMEAANAGGLAARLDQIAALPLVLAASMVFEQALEPETMDAA